MNWRETPQPGYMLFTASAVPVAKADTAVTELLRLAREIQSTKPLTAEELNFAKSSLVGSRLNQTATVETLAAAAFDVMRLRAPADFWSGYATRINALTLDNVRAVAAKYLDAAHLPIFVVGDTTFLAPS